MTSFNAQHCSQVLHSTSQGDLRKLQVASIGMCARRMIQSLPPLLDCRVLGQ
jgi:hypothetical protein